jgi:hypothetical protein
MGWDGRSAGAHQQSSLLGLVCGVSAGIYRSTAGGLDLDLMHGRAGDGEPPARVFISLARHKGSRQGAPAAFCCVFRSGATASAPRPVHVGSSRPASGPPVRSPARAVVVFPCPMCSLSSPRSAGPIRPHDLLAHGLRSCAVPIDRSREERRGQLLGTGRRCRGLGENVPRDTRARSIYILSIPCLRQAWPGHRRFAEHATCVHA